MFKTLPLNFFNLLVSKNRDIYLNSLFVLRKAVRQELYLTRDEFARRIAHVLDSALKNVDFTEEDTFENEDLTSNSSRAYFIIRRLRDYGWINIDYNVKNSFEEYIAIPAYSSLTINFLYTLSEEGETEYNSMVYSVYSALKLADAENNDFYDALVTAYKNTDRLNEALANLYYGIRSIEQRIADNVDINDVVKIHFNEYFDKLHEKYYHPYKTFDSIVRYRNPIMQILQKWQNSTFVRKKIMDLAKPKNPNMRPDELFEFITNMYVYINETYENIEDKMEIIDNKIYEYTTSSIDKMKHLANMDESYKGKLNYLIKVIVDNKENSEGICENIIDNFNICSQDVATPQGLYTKREITVQEVLQSVEVMELEKSGDDVDEMFDRIKLGYNLRKVRDFVLERVADKKEISIEDMKIECDEDFILAILAMLRGDEKELPFNVEFNEGYIHTKNYIVPNIRFVLKERSK